MSSRSYSCSVQLRSQNTWQNWNVDEREVSNYGVKTSDMKANNIIATCMNTYVRMNVTRVWRGTRSGRHVTLLPTLTPLNGKKIIKAHTHTRTQKTRPFHLQQSFISKSLIESFIWPWRKLWKSSGFVQTSHACGCTGLSRKLPQHINCNKWAKIKLQRT